MEDGLTPPLIFEHKKWPAKLELKVHVIQTLIKPLLLILHETGFLVPPFMSINRSYCTQANQSSKQSDGLLFALWIWVFFL